MSQDTFNEREFELVNILGYQIEANQRDLSRQLNLSLGATNILLHRLIAKGYIRIRRLNKKKVQYLLTPKGFAEKMRKSIKYTVNTLRHMAIIQERISSRIKAHYEKGTRNFYILGESGLGPLLELVLSGREFQGVQILKIKQWPQQEIEGVLLICEEDIVPGAHSFEVVNLIEELANSAMAV